MATLLEQLTALSTKRVLFGHQSVGNNLVYGNPGAVDYSTVGLGGFNAIFNANPTGGVTVGLSGPEDAPFSDAAIQAWQPGQWAEFEIPTNGDPVLKINNFKAMMDRCAGLGRTPDYAGFKFCFADVGESTDVSATSTIWTTYVSVMDALNVAYPGRIIFWTGAISAHPDANQGAADAKREELSQRIRDRYGSTGRVFDFSMKERIDSYGRDTIVAGIPSMAWEWSATWNPAWDNTNPVYPAGGLDAHVNNNFANRLALSYIDFLYNLQVGLPMTSAHRISGVAPLGIFFQAVNTVNEGPTSGSPYTFTSGVSQPGDLEGSFWEWDFGDPTSGTWSLTGKSRNTATGYTAAHVYETPGTYIVTLKVTPVTNDVIGPQQVYTQAITVSAFTGSTQYASASGTGNGLSEASPSSLAVGMTWVNGGTNRRLLLKRGDTFEVGGLMWNLTAIGPCLVGAYGTGARPVIHSTGITTEAISGGAADQFNNVFTVSSQGGKPHGCDWRFTDLEFVGPDSATNGETCPIGMRPGGYALVDDLLLYRVKTSLFASNLFWQLYGYAAFTNPPMGSFVVDCETGPQTTVHPTPGVSNYIHSRWLAILGCHLHDNKPYDGSHVLRIYMAHGAVISNNRIAEPGNNRHCLKLHGPCRFSLDNNDTNGMYGPDTRFVSITDNIFKHNTSTAVNPGLPDGWGVSIGPQDNLNEEWVSHIIYERNRHVGNSARLQAWMHFASPHTMVRNNTFDMTKTADSPINGAFAIIFGRETYQLTPTDIRVYNNTFYFGSSYAKASVFMANSEVVGAIDVRNNLALYPYASGWDPIEDNDNGGVPIPAGQQGNNVWLGNVAASTCFTSAPTNLSLTVSSPAIDAGATLPEVLEDYTRARRLGLMDVGAYTGGSTGGEPLPTPPDTVRGRARVSPGEGSYSTPPTVTLTEYRTGMALYATTDGSRPRRCAAHKVTGPITLGTGTTTLRILLSSPTKKSRIIQLTYVVG